MQTYIQHTNIGHTDVVVAEKACSSCLPCSSRDLCKFKSHIPLLKPVLNWANVSSRTKLEVFGEAIWFLIGPTFLHEPSWKYSSKLYSGPKSFAQHVLGTFALLADHCLWLAESRALLWMKKKQIKMDDRVARFYTRFGGNLFICWLVGGAALSLGPRMR